MDNFNVSLTENYRQISLLLPKLDDKTRRLFSGHVA